MLLLSISLTSLHVSIFPFSFFLLDISPGVVYFLVVACAAVNDLSDGFPPLFPFSPLHDLDRSLHPFPLEMSLRQAILIRSEGGSAEGEDSPVCGSGEGSCG